LLSSWGIAFEGVDLEQAPERWDDLRRLAIPSYPATILGDRFVHGWNPVALGALVGVDYDPGRRLAPDELARLLDRILAADQRAVRQIPREHLGMKHPDRDRTVRELAFHIFRLSQAFRDCRELGRYSELWLRECPGPELDDGEAIASHGQAVRDRLRDWCARPGWCDGDVHTYYGTHAARDLMERTTWHAAQHLRQMYWFLEQMGIRPAEPLTDADLAGLPLPREVWS
jgi:hypothetical protein